MRLCPICRLSRIVSATNDGEREGEGRNEWARAVPLYTASPSPPKLIHACFNAMPFPARSREFQRNGATQISKVIETKMVLISKFLMHTRLPTATGLVTKLIELPIIWPGIQSPVS